jgi:hypothetical protein
VNVWEFKGAPLRQIIELMMFVAGGPTLLCGYVLAAWALSANLSLTAAFPWSTGPLSNWMIWLVLALLLHVLTSKMQAYLSRLETNHVNERAAREFTPPRLRLTRELKQKDESQLEPIWATASSVVGTGNPL